MKVKTVAKIGIPAGAVLLVALIVALQMPRGTEVAQGMEVIVYADLPSVTDELTILKTVSPEITQDRALNIANEAFGVSGEFRKLEDVWKIWSGTDEVWMYESGAIRYYTSKVFWGMHLREELPSEPDCRDIADSYIENIKNKGLLRTDIDVTFKDVVSDEKIIAYENGTRENYVVNIHVNYSLSFNGITLSGPGAKLCVYIGEGGEITGFMGNMGGLSEEKIVEALNPEEAIELFKNRDYGASKAVINSIDLVYYVPSQDVENAYIVPVYQFTGEFTLMDGITSRFGEFVPAISQSEIENMSLS